MRRGKGGFTLVELMVVVAILGLLAGMIFPALGGVLLIAKKMMTEGQLGSLATAVRSYYQEFDSYPPSSSAEAAKCISNAGGTGAGNYAKSGAECLPLFTLGWFCPAGGGAVTVGQGFKVKDLGSMGATTQLRSVAPLYAPAKDEKKPGTDFGGAANGTYFCDKFDGHVPILYFKFKQGATSGKFEQADNSQVFDFAKWKAPTPSSFDSFVISNNIPINTEFVSWSAGPDEKFLTGDDMVK
jgi:prepilin-type N-terminal cleavage/methylation domain-containing protein